MNTLGLRVTAGGIKANMDLDLKADRPVFIHYVTICHDVHSNKFLVDGNHVYEVPAELRSLFLSWKLADNKDFSERLGKSFHRKVKAIGNEPYHETLEVLQMMQVRMRFNTSRIIGMASFFCETKLEGEQLEAYLNYSLSRNQVLELLSESF